jgi:hypothetical protein
MENYLNPPTYCPEAIATDVGWINPRNGELLVSVKNLRQRIQEHRNSVIIVQEQPQKRSRGRPKKDTDEKSND